MAGNMVSLGAFTGTVPSPVWLISSYNAENKPNIMSASWCGIVCTTPPCVGVSVKKTAATCENIFAKKAFTVSVTSAKDADIADIAGSCSGRDSDKYALASLTPLKSSLVGAPYPSEAKLVLECLLINSVDIGSHIQFIGEIRDVKAVEGILKDGKIAVDLLKPLLSSAADRHYYECGKVIRRIKH